MFPCECLPSHNYTELDCLLQFLDDTRTPPSVGVKTKMTGGDDDKRMFSDNSKSPAATQEKPVKKCEEEDYSMREIGEKCDRFCDTKTDQKHSQSNSTVQTLVKKNNQSSATRHSGANNSFLWKKSTADKNQNKKTEDVYDDVKNENVYDDVKQAYAVVSKSTENLTLSGKHHHIYHSADNLDNITYDDAETIKSNMNNSDENANVFVSNDLVTATPAVILEDDLESLNVVYDDIHKDDDQLTLYESIRGSLQRLDQIKVNIANLLRI